MIASAATDCMPSSYCDCYSTFRQSRLFACGDLVCHRRGRDVQVEAFLSLISFVRTIGVAVTGRPSLTYHTSGVPASGRCTAKTSTELLGPRFLAAC